MSIFQNDGKKLNNIKFDIPDLINVDFVPYEEEENLSMEIIPYQLPKQGLLKQ